MIQVEVIKDFSLNEFDKIQNIKRKGADTKGRLYVGDVFECDKKMADYLMGKNMSGAIVVKIIGVIVKEEKSITSEKKDVKNNKKYSKQEKSVRKKEK